MQPSSPTMTFSEKANSAPGTPTATSLPNEDAIDIPKFTVQQIMLLQKLKQSGLTKIQIIKGLEEIEKMDENGAPPSSGFGYDFNF